MPDALAKPFEGPDGALYQAVSVARSRPFALACLVEWQKLDGKDRRHLLQSAKTVSVPVAVIEPARLALEKTGAGQ